MLLNQPTRPQIGKALAAYKGEPIQNRQILAWYLPGTLTVLLIFGYGLSRTVQAQDYGPAAQATWGRPAFILAAALMAPLLIFMLRHIRSRRRMVLLHQNGISFRNISSSYKQLLWTEISGIAIRNEQIVFLRFPVGARYRMTLTPTTGRPIHLDERIQKLPELAARIKARVYPLLKEEIRGHLREGRWVYFGPVHIAKDRLLVKKQNLTWEQVKRVRVASGKLIFERRTGGEMAIPTGRVPNLELLLALLEEEITK